MIFVEVDIHNRLPKQSTLELLQHVFQVCGFLSKHTMLGRHPTHGKSDSFGPNTCLFLIKAGCTQSMLH